MTAPRYEISLRVKYLSTEEEKFRTSKPPSGIKSRKRLVLLQSCEHFYVISMSILECRPGRKFYIFFLNLLYVFFNNIDSFSYPFPVNFFGKSPLKHRKENCVIWPHFRGLNSPWPQPSPNQRARNRSVIVKMKVNNRWIVAKRARCEIIFF